MLICSTAAQQSVRCHCCVCACRCESMGKEVVYVSGRVRAPGEMNGKSGNLNNCLGQIYPKEFAIPGNEVVCVFDADQVAKRDFFLKTLPFFDSGDALLLTAVLPLVDFDMLLGFVCAAIECMYQCELCTKLCADLRRS